MLKKIYLKLKILIYKKNFSNNKLELYPLIVQPTIFMGMGKIIFNKNTQIGYDYSKSLYSGSSYIEARTNNSKIYIGENTIINNSATIVAEKANITIGKNCLIGTDFLCLNSDFHSLNPEDRLNPEKVVSKDINIKDNVFIGSNVTILKGVTIGENCVIGAGSIVTKSFNENSVIAGNPAKLVRTLE